MARANPHHIPGQVWHITHRYIEETKAMLGIKGIGRKIEMQQDDCCVLRENLEPYNAVFDPEKGCLSSENSYYWDVFQADLAS